jgi:hypothetical protein
MWWLKHGYHVLWFLEHVYVEIKTWPSSIAIFICALIDKSI